MLKHVGGYYSITEIFESADEKHMECKCPLTEEECFKLVSNYQSIGCDYVRDANDAVIFDNGFTLYNESSLGKLSVVVKYIGKWEEC